MKRLLGILLLLPMLGFAQDYGDPSFYLIDSLDISKISEQEKSLVDSCLNAFHKADVDTNRDLSPEERHVLQKLLGWKDLVSSVKEFRVKTNQCLATGWNNSGSIKPSKHLGQVIRQMEKELQLRLTSNP